MNQEPTADSDFHASAALDVPENILKTLSLGANKETRTAGLISIGDNRLTSTMILQAPDVGPHPENRDADTDPVWYPHARVMLATPKAFETIVVKVAPEPEALLHMTVLSEIHNCCWQEVQTNDV